MVYKNRTTATRGGVAIYINNKYNFIQPDDLAINTPCIFGSIFIEIQSNKYNVIVGKIYRVPITSETNSVKMYDTICTICRNLQSPLWWFVSGHMT